RQAGGLEVRPARPARIRVGPAPLIADMAQPPPGGRAALAGRTLEATERIRRGHGFLARPRRRPGTLARTGAAGADRGQLSSGPACKSRAWSLRATIRRIALAAFLTTGSVDCVSQAESRRRTSSGFAGPRPLG